MEAIFKVIRLSQKLRGAEKGPARAGPRPAGWAGLQPMGRAGPGQASMIFCGSGRVRAETCRPGPGPG